MPAMGRRARLDVDTRPGRVLLLGILANAPIFLGFILAPVLLRGDTSIGRFFVPTVTYVTPTLAAWGVWIYARADAARQHRAARIGILLCGTAIVLWLLVVLSPGARGVA